MEITLAERARILTNDAIAFKQAAAERDKEARVKFFRTQVKELTKEIEAIADQGYDSFEKSFSTYHDGKYVDEIFITQMIKYLEKEGFKVSRVENLSMDRTKHVILIKW